MAISSTISGASTGDTLLGTANDQLIQGSDSADSISVASSYKGASILGEEGADTIRALGVTSTVKAGRVDSVYLTSALDSTNFSTNTDADTVQLFATASNSKIWLGSGADSLRVAAKSTDPTVKAGSEDDTLTFALAQTSLYVDGEAGSDVIAFQEGVTTSTVLGGSGADSLYFDVNFFGFADAGEDDEAARFTSLAPD